MNRLQVRTFIGRISPHCLSVSDAEMRRIFSVTDEKYDQHSNWEMTFEPDEYESEFRLFALRTETDQEFNKRIAAIEEDKARRAKMREKTTEKDLKELARLKAKYENQSSQ